MTNSRIDAVVNLCARRALLFPTAQAYGVFAGFFDYGHYGALIKRRVEACWVERFVEKREDVVLLDASLVSPPSIWEASGHLTEFNDPLVECVKCKTRFRADSLIEEELHEALDGVSDEKLQTLVKEKKLKCEKCGGALSEIKSFNLMFATRVGAEEGGQAFLRPETAQNIFVDYKLLQLATRKQLPFGIAQVGKAFRNEISPRNFVFRTREFTQAEIEFFVHPNKKNECVLPKEKILLEVNALTAEAQEKKGKTVKTTVGGLLEKKVIGSKWLGYWLAEYFDWLTNDLGLSKENLRLRQHVREELSHYSKETWDFEFNYGEMGWKELMGVADRGDFDLRQHEKHSKKDFALYDEEKKEKIVPHVIEPSLGIDRLVFALLLDAFSEKEGRIILSLKKEIAPVQVIVLPLMKKDGLAEKAQEVYELLKREGITVEYDEGGSIGKRYARADEVGIPRAVTIDYETLEDNSVTVRDRDSGKQERVKASELKKVFDV